MFCTACEITTTELAHYKTQFHNTNVNRKFNGYPPLTIEEFDSEAKTEDLSLSLNMKTTIDEEFNKDVLEKSINLKSCMFCTEKDTPTHHRVHGLSDEQAYYIKNLTCYICYERFAIPDMLIKHMDSNEHRVAYTDGSSLFLENGKVLNKGVQQTPVALITRRETGIPKPPKYENEKITKIKEEKEKEKLNVSIINNRQYGKFLH